MRRVGPGLTPALFCAIGVASVLAGLRIVLIGLLVRDVPASVAASEIATAAQRALILLAGSVVLGAAATSVSKVLLERLSLRVAADSERRLLSVCGAPEDIAHLERVDLLNVLAVARGTVSGVDTGAVVAGVATSFRQRANAVVSAVILFAFAWWAPVLLAAAATAQFTYARSLFANLFKGWIRDAEHLRAADYRRNLTLIAEGAKEVRIFGWGGWLLGQYDVAWRGSMAKVWSERRTIWLRAVATYVPVGAVLVFVGMKVADAALKGEINVGTAVMMLQAAILMIQSSTYQNEQIFGAHAAGALSAIEQLEAMAPSAALPKQAASSPVPLSAPIVLSGVTFSYPSSQQPVLDGVDLVIEPGSTVALVGENGAGKTTLVKLLARLYEPQGGSISIGATPLREISHAEWRSHVGAIFQDFAQWELSLRDNVRFGDLAADPSDDRVRAALALARGDALEQESPSGLDTILSRGFEGGTDLSGGQWQRVALARALIGVRQGGLLILDEPTASLDVRAEAELFDATIDLAGGVTTLLVSHRFTTVRKAQRILVLDRGRIAEDGSHDELMALGGQYAQMFTLQAERFRDEQA